MTKLNKALMATTAIAFAGGLALPAAAQQKKAPDPSAAPGVVKSGKKVKLRLYGQITRQFGFVQDGETSTFKQGANGNTSNRMGIDGRGKITKDISLRTRLEFAIAQGANGGGTQFENQGGSNDFDIRHADVIISHKRYGAIWIGRGDTVTNGTSEINLAGNSTARLGGTTTNMISSIVALDTDMEPASVRTVGSFFSNLDGANRQNRIRYDTPTFFGFKAGVGIIDKHNVDAAVRYSGKFAGTAVRGGVGWCHTKGSQSAGSGTCFGNGTSVEGRTQINGSVSVLTPLGLGGAMSGGYQWPNRGADGHATVGNPFTLNPSIFYKTKVTELGDTVFEYAYQYAEEITAIGDEGQAHTVTIMQKVDSVGGDYFVGFTYADVETATNQNIDAVWWVGGGFRQRF
ncbi:MAG: porin [Alphaproteobacteria bacterium]|nr:porin [Alphaproteobacteria bacterium]